MGSQAYYTSAPLFAVFGYREASASAGPSKQVSDEKTATANGLFVAVICILLSLLWPLDEGLNEDSYNRLLVVIICVLLGLLQPLDEGLDVLEEHVAPLGVAALLVPEHDGIFTNDVSIIQHAHDVREQLE